MFVLLGLLGERSTDICSPFFLQTPDPRFCCQSSLRGRPMRFRTFLFLDSDARYKTPFLLRPHGRLFLNAAIHTKRKRNRTDRTGPGKGKATSQGHIIASIRSRTAIEDATTTLKTETDSDHQKDEHPDPAFSSTPPSSDS